MQHEGDLHALNSVLYSDDGRVAVCRVGTARHQAFQVRDRSGDSERGSRFREDGLDGLLQRLRGHLHAGVQGHHSRCALHAGFAAHVHRAADRADVAEDGLAAAGER